MRASRIAVVVSVVGMGLVGLAWVVDVRLAVPLAALVGCGIGVIGARLWSHRRPHQRSQKRSGAAGAVDDLLRHLIEMGDALHEVSADRLEQRGGWDRDLFDGVLAHVEGQTPEFQAALTAYLTGADRPSARCVQALLAVDRLSAAYTYWTRLFPPRKQAESMFVLSLLHDLSDKVETAIRILNDERR